MANSFKRYTAESVTAETVVITAPVDTEITMIGMTIANTDTVIANIDIKLNSTYMLKNAPVFVGGAMTPIGGEQKVVMEAGDVLTVTSDSTVDIIVSALEKN